MNLRVKWNFLYNSGPLGAIVLTGRECVKRNLHFFTFEIYWCYISEETKITEWTPLLFGVTCFMFLHCSLNCGHVSNHACIWLCRHVPSSSWLTWANSHSCYHISSWHSTQKLFNGFRDLSGVGPRLDYHIITALIPSRQCLYCQQSCCGCWYPWWSRIGTSRMAPGNPRMVFLGTYSIWILFLFLEPLD